MYYFRKDIHWPCNQAGYLFSPDQPEFFGDQLSENDRKKSNNNNNNGCGNGMGVRLKEFNFCYNRLQLISKFFT